MSILEWICIAAIPIYLLCNNKVVPAQQHQVNTYLKSTLCILGVTSLLSFTSIIALSSRSDKASHISRNPRKDDAGIVIGAHLVPLMYYALYLFSCKRRDSSNVSIENEVGLQHVLYSSCGGLAFVMSYIIFMTFGRLKQRKSNVKEEKSPELHRQIMQLCWKVYLALLCAYQAYLMIQQYSKINIHGAQLGFLHIIMIGYYSQNTVKIKGKDAARIDQKQWQDAFTCGEWMVLSNLITSLIGDFILYQWTTIDNTNREFLPEHMRIAQAGLAGCIVGLAICQFSSRILPDLDMFGSLTGVFGIAAGFLEVTVHPPLIESKQGDWLLFIPKSIRWLVQFLSHEVEMEIGNSLNRVKRYVILGYWGFVLIASVPLTMKLCSWVQLEKMGHNHVRKKARRVVAARKFFHLIALLLFAPITWLDPDMMALSYAIAIALLMVIEIIRCYSFGLEKGSSVLSFLNAFYATFLDEKDSNAAEGGLTITHITLILGTAIPLWMYQMIMNLSGENKVPIFFLPYVGVLALGVGDSVGAIAGIAFGRHSWPGSSRTIEGSCCMLLSMVIPLYLASVEDVFDIGKTLAIVTLVEASTSQIDNLCLPLIGTTLVALSASS
jgi:dolichol kinase